MTDKSILTRCQQLYNLSDEAFDFSIFGFVPNAYVQPTDPTVPTQIWSPEDIVIVSRKAPYSS
jgi:hypothetical protein